MTKYVIKIEESPFYASLQTPFMATSLRGDWCSKGMLRNQKVLLDKTLYPRFGSNSPRTRFYIFKSLIKSNKVQYVITSQNIPIIYLDSFEKWHSLKEIRSKVGVKHIRFLEQELDIKDTNMEEMADVFVSTINIDDESDYETQIESAIHLAMMEYKEDQILEK